MAEFLTAHGTSFHIENIIIDAHKSLTLVSPYLKISKTLFERLKDANSRGVSVSIIYGKEDLNHEQKSALTELRKLELYFSENLHAKCYFNENKMVITSMNMYEFSEKNNREMGILIDSDNDKTIYDKAVQEVKSIIQSSKREYLQHTNHNPNTNYQQKTNNRRIARGYCIRCENEINYNPTTPYCNNCYQTWSNFQNPFYEENVCHRCGKPEVSTMQKPQCYSCYNATTM